MDKVLKRRLIGATILIALAVIFVPMLLVDPDSVDGGGYGDVEVPSMPDTAREVRRIPLDPESTRVDGTEPPSRALAEPPVADLDDGRMPGDAVDGSRVEEAASQPPREEMPDEIVLRPERDAGPAAVEPSVAEAGPDVEVEPRVEPAPAADEEPAPGDSARQTTEAPSLGDWAVQVASFSAAESAAEVRGRLETLGHIVARDEIVRGETLLFRLRTGPYPSREAAETARAQIAATISGVEPIVVELDEGLGEDGEDGFAVQVGSFAGADNAERETARLRSLDFDAFRFSEPVGQRTIWRVLVGPVPTREEADRLRDEVVERAGVEGLVVSVP
ncbi:MAG: SPOR domain-containing protein [Wenzhouxiangellaceae bacterium]|nr:SPOR domain-containing protein [Wenzhouxiangellaceae bacterium]